MANDIKLKAGTHTNIVTSGSSIAAGASTSQLAGTGFDNATNCDESITAILAAAGFSGSTPAAGDTIALYLVPQGMSFDTSTPYGPDNYRAGLFQVPLASTSAQGMAIDGILLSAIVYDVYLINNSVGGVTGYNLDFYGTRHQST